MDNRNDISANDLLEKLKANMNDGDAEDTVSSDGVKKKFKYRRSEAQPVGYSKAEEDETASDNGEKLFESPVPRSEVEGLDIDALMKKYLSEEEYEQMVKKSEDTEVGESDDTVSLAVAEETDADRSSQDELDTDLDILSAVDADEAYEDGSELADIDDVDSTYDVDDTYISGEDYTAPDESIFMDLSEDGKVCDVPKEFVSAPTNSDEHSDAEEPGEESEPDYTKTSAAEIFDEYSADFETKLAYEAADTSRGGESSSETAVFDIGAEKETDSMNGDTKVGIDAAVQETAVFGEQIYFEQNDNEEPLGGLDTVTEEKTDTWENAKTEEFDLEKVSIAFVNGDSEVVRSRIDLNTGKETDNEHGESFTESDGDEPEEEKTFGNLPSVAEDAGTDELGGESENENTEASAQVDEIDANLMLAFEMEDELDKALGKENADKLRENNENAFEDDESDKKPKKEKAPEKLREFISPAETREILDNYRAEYGKSALRIFAVAVIAILLFFYENIMAFGGGLSEAFNPNYYPIVNIMSGLQLLVFGAAIMYKSLIKGAKAVMDRKLQPESVLCLIILMSLVYSVILCFFAAGSSFATYYFPASLALLLTAVNDRIEIRRETMAFKIISSKMTKLALEKLDVDQAELETRAFDEFLPKQPAIFKINKTSFIDGYFRRTKQYPSIKHIISAFVTAVIAIAVVGLLGGFILLGQWQKAVMLSYAAFTFATPVSLMIAFGLPMLKASQAAFSEKSALVGESALDEYTSAASISFDDREVFPTNGVKLKSVKVFGTGRIDLVIYYAASIYALLGGPLSDVLNVATADLGRSDDTEVLSIGDDGVEAAVDERHIYLGKASYLRKNGYVPVLDADDEELEKSGDISVLFLVADDEVIAKLYIRYRIDPSFEGTIKRLYKSGICVGIKTVDPNINDEMLSTRIKLEKYPVRVLKYSDVTESRRGTDRTDSGIVSLKSAKALLSTFTVCDKTKHVTNTNLVIGIITMLSGLVIAAAVAFLGDIGGISSIYAALFQAFWLIPVYLLSKFLL